MKKTKKFMKKLFQKILITLNIILNYVYVLDVNVEYVNVTIYNKVK